MGRIFDHPGDRAAFHDVPGIHNGNISAGLGHHAQIMRDQKHADVMIGHRAIEQLQDLRLHRYIKRSCRFVDNQQIGPPDQRMAISTRWRIPPESS